MKVKRHDVRKYDSQRGLQWVDHRGEKVGRLLYTAWVGYWHDRAWWHAECDCGRSVIVRFRPDSTLSCGCANADANRVRDFRHERLDGTWGLEKSTRVVLPDGTTAESARQLARMAGVGPQTMDYRMKHWPAERWLEPPQARGLGAARHRKTLIRKRTRERRSRKPQPWSAANIAKANQANRRRREGPDDVQ